MLPISTRRLRLQVIVYALLAMAVMGLAVAATATVPLYRQLSASAENRLEHALELQALAIGEVVGRARSLAAQVTSRTVIRDALERHLDGAIPLDELRRFSAGKLADAMNLSEELLAIRRHGPDGALLIEVGEPMPPEAVAMLPDAGDALGPPVSVGDRLLIAVAAPILNRDGRVLGQDVILFDAGAIKGIVEDGRHLGATGETVVAARAGESWRVFPDAGSGCRLDRAPEAFRGTEAFAFDAAPGDERVGRAGVVPGTDWVATVCVSRGELLSGVRVVVGAVALSILGVIAVGMAGMVLLLRPLTGRMLVQADDLAAQNEELRRARLRLEQANSELSEFAYVTSHDLQEPLRQVTSYVQLLKRRYGGRLDAEADTFIGYVVEATLRMHRLIADLREYCGTDQEKPPPGPVDLNRVFHEVTSRLARPIARTGASVTAGSLPLVAGEPADLIRVIEALVENALKFHRPDSPPQVVVTAERYGGEWVVAVRDQGIGIEPQYLDQIFGVFKRLHTREAFPGNGIGLAICKKIVGRWGGRIWAESEPGVGATLRFTVPAAPTPPASSTADARPSATALS